ncbi:MAG: class I SAM-dependent methyltransferase [Clostridia bacterium]|nr:class I SAM-dependent methyltransferase [Clostridia bacterium]
MHKSFPIISCLSSLIINRIMTICVRHSYNTNDYNACYRKREYLTSFEEKCIAQFLSVINNPTPKILDVGCGSGKPYDQFLLSKNCQLVGVDISKKQIELARLNAPSAKYININFLRYNTSEKFDGVIMLYSLFHVSREYHRSFLEKIYSMLNDGGKVLLNVRKEDNLLKFRHDFCGKSMFWSHYDYKTFKKILRETGFKFEFLGDEKNSGSSESHVWLLLHKKN